MKIKGHVTEVSDFGEKLKVIGQAQAVSAQPHPRVGVTLVKYTAEAFKSALPRRRSRGHAGLLNMRNAH